jgi:purine-binding chemotaxis protein CheW
VSARRFRAENDYFGKRSQLPDELIGCRGTRFTGNSQDATLVSEENHDEKPEVSNRQSLKSNHQTYLAFRLRGQGYVLETSKVKEIIRQIRIIPIPRTPRYMKGVANLRGRVIPVVDLGLKLGMEGTDFTEQTCIIVVEVTGSTAPVPVGIVVEGVSDVIKINDDQIQKAPVLDFDADTAYISGMALLKDSINILVNIDRVLGEDAKAGERDHKAIIATTEKGCGKEMTVHEKREVKSDQTIPMASDAKWPKLGRGETD